MTPCQTSQQCLRAAVVAVRALEAALQPSFGPLGQELMLRGPEGLVESTAIGSVILDSLHLAHPIASMLAMAAKSHAKRTGDGAKTFVLVVAAALRQAEAELHSGSRAQVLDLGRGERVALVRALACIHGGPVQRVLAQVLRHISVRVPCGCQRGGLATRAAMLAVLHTLFAGKLPPRTAFHVSRLLVRLVERHCLTETRAVSLSEAVCQLSARLPALRVPHTTADESQLLEGVVFPGTFLSPHMARSLERCRFLVASQAVDGDDSADAAGGRVLVTSQQAYRACVQQRERAVAERLAMMRQHGVRLLLCTGQVSELVAHYCLQLGLSAVQHVSEEDAARICDAAGVHPLQGNTLRDIQHAPLGVVSSCRETVLGSLRFIHLRVSPPLPPPPQPDDVEVACARHACTPREDTSLKSNGRGLLPEGEGRETAESDIRFLTGGQRSPHTLVICGASEGQCRRLQQMLACGISALASMFAEPSAFVERHSGPIPDSFQREGGLRLAPGGAATWAALDCAVQVAGDRWLTRCRSSTPRARTLEEGVEDMEVAPREADGRGGCGGPGVEMEEELGCVGGFERGGDDDDDVAGLDACQLAAALRVVRAMTGAASVALARNGSAMCASRWRDWSRQRGILRQVHALRSRHLAAAALPCRAGIIDPHGAPARVCGCLQRALLGPAWRPEPPPEPGEAAEPANAGGAPEIGWDFVIDDAVAHGIIEPAASFEALFTEAFSFVIQVLRIDAIIPTRHRATLPQPGTQSLRRGGTSASNRRQAYSSDENCE